MLQAVEEGDGSNNRGRGKETTGAGGSDRGHPCLASGLLPPLQEDCCQHCIPVL